jgi:transcription-repair coupling factor (superfamily II helicase)
MTDTLEPQARVTHGRRLLGLPAVARLAHFARHAGAAVLITTDERLARFSDTGAFGVAHSLNPELSSWPERLDKVLVTVAHALRPFPSEPEAYALVLELHREYRREALLETLLTYGYERDSEPGFAVLGDTVTLYLHEDNPFDTVRLEFFGDELDRIVRRTAQEGAEQLLTRYVLTPRPEVELQDDAWESRLIEHLPGTVFLDVPELFAGDVGETQASWLWDYLQQRQVISFGRDALKLETTDPNLTPLGYYRGKLSELRNDLGTWLSDGYSVSLLLKFERTGRYLREKVMDDLASRWHNTVQHHPGQIGLVIAPEAEGGVLDAAAKEVLVTESLLYGAQGARRLKRLPGRRVHDAVQLSVGDYLIHPDHGIGRFVGLEPKTVLGVTRDYLMLQFAGEGKLYLPVELLPLLRRHPGTTDDPPRLSTLGTNEWARARERARVSAQELAMKLIKTYAERQISEGVSMPAIPDWDALIAENCPFTLTPDQASAVEAVYSDMAKPTPMDRLISGDVGFGKTEVAVRAAHRAVGNGKQAAVLVPTTILANQHYETFRERFAGLPVRVEMLSRFTGERDAKEILAGLKMGSVDIVIGTHRLLNDAIAFKDLGLLVIDEEHRFGVAQKEKMKSLKANLDVLSLSATPIPRTLYMSLVGLRDVSQIMTPPEGRKPIQTVLQPYDALAVREAVMFELERGGKTYYIHDRVGSMGMRARTLAQLIPEARIGVAHGQMNSDELEEIMLGFQQGAYDILLATTIVESGLDVAGANTLIIERADKLGLAQLYQLRGRVGRRQTEAWAHLFYPGRITEQAQRRLYAIAELNDLGSGHLLAEKDMEIRGVGNLLGPEQHGQIAAVSLEVYTEMLAEEISKLKGEQRAEAPPMTAIDLSIDARLSPSYIQDDDMRIEYYGRLGEATGLAEVSRIARELRERYGPLPQDVKTFIELVKLRLLATAKGVATIKEHMTDIQLSFTQETLDYDAKRLKELPFTAEPTRYPPGFSIKKRGLNSEALVDAISQVLYLCG